MAGLAMATLHLHYFKIRVCRASNSTLRSSLLSNVAARELLEIEAMATLLLSSPAMTTTAIHSSGPPRRNFYNVPSATNWITGPFSVACVGDSNGGFLGRFCAQKIRTTGRRRSFQICYQKQEVDQSTSITPTQAQKSSSRSFVGGLLEKALTAFIRTQLDQCGDLSVAVGGSNWELLSGNVQEIQVSATKAVYKEIALTEVELTASKVLIKLGRKRLLQHPFHVNAQIRVQEEDLDASLASPLFSKSLRQILPKKPPTLHVEYDGGNLRISTPDQRNGRYGQMEYPITLQVHVQNGGEVILVDSVKNGSIQNTFKVGPELKITDLRIEKKWLEFVGDFKVSP